jgi:hypothetical protein
MSCTVPGGASINDKPRGKKGLDEDQYTSFSMLELRAHARTTPSASLSTAMEIRWIKRLAAVVGFYHAAAARDRVGKASSCSGSTTTLSSKRRNTNELSFWTNTPLSAFDLHTLNLVPAS